MPIKNYRTTIPEDKTIAEIMGLLAAKGARAIQIDYDDKQRPKGVSFIVPHSRSYRWNVYSSAVPLTLQLRRNLPGDGS